MIKVCNGATENINKCHDRFHHENADLHCICGVAKYPTHSVFCRITRRISKRFASTALRTAAGAKIFAIWLEGSNFLGGICPLRWTHFLLHYFYSRVHLPLAIQSFRHLSFSIWSQTDVWSLSIKPYARSCSQKSSVKPAAEFLLDKPLRYRNHPRLRFNEALKYIYVISTWR